MDYQASNKKMRLTLDLIEHATSFTNPLGERELDLRGNKIPSIENLGATKDMHDTLDLSDNELRKLENFPLLPRVSTILASNNFIKKIEPLETKLPHLHTLILSNNMIEDIRDIECLQKVASLWNLSLLGNPVTSKAQYRLAAIKCFPQLRVLDFQKISPQERKQAAAKPAHP